MHLFCDKCIERREELAAEQGRQMITFPIYLDRLVAEAGKGAKLIAAKRPPESFLVIENGEGIQILVKYRMVQFGAWPQIDEALARGPVTVSQVPPVAIVPESASVQIEINGNYDDLVELYKSIVSAAFEGRGEGAP